VLVLWYIRVVVVLLPKDGRGRWLCSIGLDGANTGHIPRLEILSSTYLEGISQLCSFLNLIPLLSQSGSAIFLNILA